MIRVDKLLLRDFTVRADKTRRAHDLVEVAVAQKLMELEALAEKELADLDSNHPLLEDLGYDHWAIQEEVPQVLRAALFMQAYGLFEKYLNRVAEVSGENRSLLLRPTDLRDNGIQQSVTYLKRACGITVPTESSEWSTLLRLLELRNLFAHNRGMVRPGDKLVREFVAAHATLIVIERNEIRLHQGFVPFAIDQMEMFGKLLNSVLD